ncbi:phosphatidylinositol mannoside acyltransferase [Catellatospora tritici]|uniref:phosphatidylinositol mannoside acyltransferase n=1 Tax=Catellatospora tritici TaxID=2851566 RepID=UPI001C2D103C|nr:phosphatidylinositol mannoside acyltransferase [Catellatospora tritici]MBV1850342.1 phosphatidylinositol mannoside acyltransferase [Catellatospora tritici]
MRDRLVDLSYAGGWRLVRAMPHRAASALFRAGADRAAGKRGPSVQRLERNLSIVLGRPAPPELVRAAMRSYARYWLEAFRLPSQSPAQLRDGFRLHDFDKLVAAHQAGTGAIVALPHAGNWDAAGAMVTAHGLPLTTVAERLRPEGLYQRFLEFREGLGMSIIPTTGGNGSPVDLLAERLGQAHIVPLLADRDLSARGVEVEFFGGRTRMPAGPALLALRTGAPLFLVDMWYEPDAPCGRVVGPLPLPDPGAPLDTRVRLLTQQVADGLARGIAANPADWHMLQKLWLSEPGAADPKE